MARKQSSMALARNTSGRKFSGGQQPGHNNAETVCHEFAHAFAALLSNYSPTTVLTRQDGFFLSQWPDQEPFSEAEPFQLAAMASAGILFDVFLHEIVRVDAGHNELMEALLHVALGETDPLSDAMWAGNAFREMGDDVGQMKMALEMARAAATTAGGIFIHRRKMANTVAMLVEELPADGSEGLLIEPENLRSSYETGTGVRIVHVTLLKRPEVIGEEYNG